MMKHSIVKRAVRWSMVLLPMAVLASLWWTGAPSRQVTPSRETTYFTEPVLPSGQIDYVSAVEKHLAGDVQPEENAVALLMSAYPVPSVPQKNLRTFYEELGIEQPDPTQTKWSDWRSFSVREILTPDDESTVVADDDMGIEPVAVTLLGDADVDQLLTRVRTAPWSEVEFPPVADLLRQSDHTLSILLEAVERPEAYQPGVFADRHSLMLRLLPIAQHAPTTAEQFAVAAMYHLEAGDEDLAWRYCLGAHRLARHVAGLGSLMDYLVGCKVAAIAHETSESFLQYASSESSRRRLDEFTALGPFPDASAALEVGERCTMLDSLQSIVYGEPIGENPEGHGMTCYLINSRADWNAVFKRANSLYDRCLIAFQEPDYLTSTEQIDGIMIELDALHAGFRPEGAWPASEEEVQRHLLAGIAMMFPALHLPRQRQEIAAQQNELLQTALAWQAYRQDKNHAPKALNDLVPEYLPKLLLDRFAKQPLAVAEHSPDVTIYSLGPDGINDGGLPFDAESGLGDVTIVIRAEPNSVDRRRSRE